MTLLILATLIAWVVWQVATGHLLVAIASVVLAMLVWLASGVLEAIQARRNTQRLFAPQHPKWIRDRLETIRRAEFEVPAVHDDDIDLVGPRDVKWYSKLSPVDVDLLRATDLSFQAAILSSRLQNGDTAEDVAKEIWRTRATYYLALDERNAVPPGFTQADLRLPFAIKDRINRAIMNSSVRRRLEQELPQVTSANAWFRAAIRRNEI